MFQVTDAETGQPIEGATIHQFDKSKPNPDRPDGGWEGRTGSDGNYGIASECFTDGESITYPEWTFTVSAQGYQERGPLRLTDYTGARGNRSYKQITVRLVRVENGVPK
jgi:hypothetical protein